MKNIFFGFTLSLTTAVTAFAQTSVVNAQPKKPSTTAASSQTASKGPTEKIQLPYKVMGDRVVSVTVKDPGGTEGNYHIDGGNKLAYHLFSDEYDATPKFLPLPATKTTAQLLGALVTADHKIEKEKGYPTAPNTAVGTTVTLTDINKRSRVERVYSMTAAGWHLANSKTTLTTAAPAMATVSDDGNTSIMDQTQQIENQTEVAAAQTQQIKTQTDVQTSPVPLKKSGHSPASVQVSVPVPVAAPDTSTPSTVDGVSQKQMNTTMRELQNTEVETDLFK